MNGHEGHPILKSVKHCPSCGSAEIHFAEGKAVVCDSCGLTLFFNAAAAVAVLLVDKAGESSCSAARRTQAKAS
jgi:NADH pyrophosphatase NudC (nudix superfamily)